MTPWARAVLAIALPIVGCAAGDSAALGVTTLRTATRRRSIESLQLSQTADAAWARATIHRHVIMTGQAPRPFARLETFVLTRSGSSWHIALATSSTAPSPR